MLLVAAHGDDCGQRHGSIYECLPRSSLIASDLRCSCTLRCGRTDFCKQSVVSEYTKAAAAISYFETP